jgi:hypothetical protein
MNLTVRTEAREHRPQYISPLGSLKVPGNGIPGKLGASTWDCCCDPEKKKKMGEKLRAILAG